MLQAELDAVMKYLQGIEDRCIAKARGSRACIFHMGNLPGWLKIA